MTVTMDNVMINFYRVFILLNLLVATTRGRSAAYDFGNHCRKLDASKRYYCPLIRYCPWDFYSGQTRVFLEDIGYIRGEWNFKEQQVDGSVGGSVGVDGVDFDSLATTAQNNLLAVGYDADRHDCCNGHYLHYDWSEFDEAYGYKGAKDAFRALGYDENSWTNNIPQKFDDAYWDELPPDVQQLVSDELCYNRELWDKIPLPKWPKDAQLPGVLYPGEHEGSKCLLQCIDECEGSENISE